MFFLLGAFAGRGNLGLFLEAMSGVPRTTPTFGDLLEGLIELGIYLPTHQICNPKPPLAVLLQLFMDTCKEVKNPSDPSCVFPAEVK